MIASTDRKKTEPRHAENEKRHEDYRDRHFDLTRRIDFLRVHRRGAGSASAGKASDARGGDAGDASYASVGDGGRRGHSLQAREAV